MAKQPNTVSREDIRYRVLNALNKAYFGKPLNSNYIQVCNTFWKVFFGTILVFGPVLFLLRATVGRAFHGVDNWLDQKAEQRTEPYETPVWAKKTGSAFATGWKVTKIVAVFLAKKIWWLAFPLRWTLTKIAKGVAWFVVTLAQKSAPFFKRHGENIFGGFMLFGCAALLGVGIYCLVISGVEHGWWLPLVILGGIVAGIALLFGLIVLLERQGGAIWKATKAFFRAVGSLIAFFARMFWSALVGFKENHCPVWKVSA